MPSTVSIYGVRPVIKINGTRSRDLDAAQVELVVHDHLHLPDMLELRLVDHRREVLPKTGAEIGKPISVASAIVGSNEPEKPIFDGEITAIEAEFDEAGGSHLVLRAYDKTHRLMNGRHTRAFHNVNLAELVSLVGREAQMTVEAAGSYPVYRHIAQVTETNWEFLRRLARENGAELCSEFGKLVLRRPQPSTSAPSEGTVGRNAQPLQAVLGVNLLSVRSRITATEQDSRVVVKGWNWVEKLPMTGTATVQTQAVTLSSRRDPVSGKFPQTTAISSNRPYETQAHVDAAAKALAEMIAAAKVEVYGTLQGNPTVKAGAAISISGTGEQFDGRFVVTATRHEFNDVDGYRTHFEITGRHDRSVLALTGAGPTDSGNHRISGVVCGIVTNNGDDDDGYGRVKVKFPWLDDQIETDWIRVAFVDAGPDGRGTYFLPEVNDEVLIAFEHGDFRRPYVIGSLYNGRDKPLPRASKQGKVEIRQIRTRRGHHLMFNDEEGNGEGICLKSANGKHEIKIDQTAGKMTIISEGVTIELSETGTMKVTADGNIDIKSTSGDITLDAGVNLAVKARGNLSLEAGGITTLKGSTVNIN